MRTKVIILTILAIMAMLIPTASALADAQFWTGTSQAEVVETLQVLGSAQGAPLANDYVLNPITINRGETFTKTLWVKNTSTLVDYTITPIFACSSGAITCPTVGPKPVVKGTTVAFDFVMTGVTAENATVRFSFQHN
jgi:hypothetical protein